MDRRRRVSIASASVLAMDSRHGGARVEVPGTETIVMKSRPHYSLPVPGYPVQLDLTTFSTRLLDRLVVFVCKPGMDIGDDDWARYVDWLKAIQSEKRELNILTAPDGRPPSSSQRSLLNRELDTEKLRLAVLLSDPKLVVIVKVSSWFMRSAEPFRAHELEKALAFLGESNVAGVRTAIRELGGVVHNTAR